MLFSTKEIADRFGKNESWVYSKLHELGIKPKRIINADCVAGFKNLYGIEQINLIENKILKSKYTMIVEVNYYIFESLGNFYQLEELKSEEWEK